MSETVVEQTPEAPASFFDKLTTDPKMAILFTYVGLIILAITPIYVGSMKSIKQPKVPKSVIIKILLLFIILLNIFYFYFFIFIFIFFLFGI